MREPLTLVARRGKNHLQTEEKEDDATSNLNGIIVDLKKYHELATKKSKKKDNEQGNDQFSQNNDALSFWLNPS
ncbi:MAG: hypothetical protein ACD_17C00238G0002 [uncultured bacterium]|nr:MAG: hypothetical protein ACD_17C00238G0002 [uncultured bacterium]